MSRIIRIAKVPDGFCNTRRCLHLFVFWAHRQLHHTIIYTLPGVAMPVQPTLNSSSLRTHEAWMGAAGIYNVNYVYMHCWNLTFMPFFSPLTPGLWLHNLFFSGVFRGLDNDEWNIQLPTHRLYYTGMCCLPVAARDNLSSSVGRDGNDSSHVQCFPRQRESTWLIYFHMHLIQICLRLYEKLERWCFQLKWNQMEPLIHNI